MSDQKENFYCMFDIYSVDDPNNPFDIRHVMNVTAKTEKVFKMWEKACNQTEGLYIDREYAVLSDWAWEMHRKRDIDNGVQQFQTSEGV